jgi:hypothetical protein
MKNYEKFQYIDNDIKILSSIFQDINSGLLFGLFKYKF